MQPFIDDRGQEILLSQIKGVVGAIDTKCQATGSRMADPEGPCYFTIELADGTTRESKEYADRESAATAMHELKVALRERRD